MPRPGARRAIVSTFAWLSALGVTQSMRAQAAKDAAATPRDVSAELEAIRADLDVPALGAGALCDGELVALGASGMRKRGGKTPVTADDHWHLGSCTKAMTATLLALLVERDAAASAGVDSAAAPAARRPLRFSATLAELLPADRFPMHATWRSVTLSQLLQHRAGLERDFPPPIWRAMRGASDQAAARTEAVRSLMAGPPPRAPGSPMLYSNAGYVIAGVVVEQALGQSWEEAMRTLLFAPLGMTSAGFGTPDDGSETQPWGHASDGTHAPVVPGKHSDNPASLGPAGTVHASLRDWAKFIALHTGHVAGVPLVGEATLTRLHDPEDDEYALGWLVVERPWAGGHALTHSGSNTMWYATVWAAPAKGIAVFAACNQGGDDAALACDRAVTAMLAHARRDGSREPPATGKQATGK